LNSNTFCRKMLAKFSSLTQVHKNFAEFMTGFLCGPS
jgi:hypothetical protein